MAAAPTLLDMLLSLGWVREEGVIRLPRAHVPTCVIHLADIRTTRHRLLEGPDSQAAPAAVLQAVLVGHAAQVGRPPRSAASPCGRPGWALRLRLDPEGCLPEDFLEPWFYPLR